MYKGNKWGSAILALLLICTGTNFTDMNVKAASINNSDEAEVEYIIPGDLEVFLPEREQPAGILLSGSKVWTATKEDGISSIQWGHETGYISQIPLAVDQQKIETKEVSSDIILVNEKAAVFNEQGEIYAYIYANGIYPFEEELEDYFEVMLGGIKGRVLKSDQVSKTADKDDSENMEPNAIEPEETTGLELESENIESIPGSITDKGEGAETADEPAAQQTNKYEAAVSSVSFHYFSAKEDTIIYDNSTGKLLPVGTLLQGETYESRGESGNWLKVRFGNTDAFVYKASVNPGLSTSIRNLNGSADTKRSITIQSDISVYDNSSGALVPFAVLKKGVTYPIVGQMGSWYKINISGRLGFVHSGSTSLNFLVSDRYFKANIDKLSVYDNSSGSLKEVAQLKKNNVYQRIKDYGNWHQINIGGKILYVLKKDTEPDNGSSIANHNSLPSLSNQIIAISKTPVYDNTSGALKEFGSINANAAVRILGKAGSWYKVELGGRYGFVHENSVKLPFKANDKYFEVLNQTAVYDNSSGILTKVAVLPKGQTFERVQDSGNWHKIKYGRAYGYVWKADTRPSTIAKAGNWGNPAATDIDFIAKSNTAIYDNSSGSLVPFITILENERYPIIGEAGSWWKIASGGRVGYVHKTSVLVGPIYKYSNYTLTLNQMLNIQSGLRPQTDLYRNNKSYIHSDFVKPDQPGKYPGMATVTADSLNVREGTGTNYWAVGSLSLGQRVEILAKTGDWYEIKFGPWKNAKDAEVARYLDPFNIRQDSADYFQFLVLSQNAGISVSDLNSRILENKGILKGTGQAFIQASMQYSINEIYLLSHALLETGNGSSKLANGILVSSVDGKPVAPKVVYNMFGIGAVDRCPESCGAETAYKNGWFTPEAAIIGGAQFISSKYVNNPLYKQDTLYKMRWNPGTAGTHQYATDIGWAGKQVGNIKKLYDSLDRYTLYFDVPVYHK
ncbi:SH3 domain-containing protein [Bacillus infantis]|uniref:SH3 domain-containing protein n=1 Tax=Bacillus infantis TaxID=324767 RepID=UPI003CEE9C12